MSWDDEIKFQINSHGFPTVRSFEEFTDYIVMGDGLTEPTPYPDCGPYVYTLDAASTVDPNSSDIFVFDNAARTITVTTIDSERVRDDHILTFSVSQLNFP